MEICPAPPAHLMIGNLPCTRLTLRWQPNGLAIEASGGTLETMEEAPPDTKLATIVRIPGR